MLSTCYSYLKSAWQNVTPYLPTNQQMKGLALILLVGNAGALAAAEAARPLRGRVDGQMNALDPTEDYWSLREQQSNPGTVRAELQHKNLTYVDFTASLTYIPIELQLKIERFGDVESIREYINAAKKLEQKEEIKQEAKFLADYVVKYENLKERYSKNEIDVLNRLLNPLVKESRNSQLPNVLIDRGIQCFCRLPKEQAPQCLQLAIAGFLYAQQNLRPIDVVNIDRMGVEIEGNIAEASANQNFEALARAVFNTLSKNELEVIQNLQITNKEKASFRNELANLHSNLLIKLENLQLMIIYGNPKISLNVYSQTLMSTMHLMQSMLQTYKSIFEKLGDQKSVSEVNALRKEIQKLTRLAFRDLIESCSHRQLLKHDFQEAIVMHTVKAKGVKESLENFDRAIDRLENEIKKERKKEKSDPKKVSSEQEADFSYDSKNGFVFSSQSLLATVFSIVAATGTALGVICCCSKGKKENNVEKRVEATPRKRSQHKKEVSAAPVAPSAEEILKGFKQIIQERLETCEDINYENVRNFSFKADYPDVKSENFKKYLTEKGKLLDQLTRELVDEILNETLNNRIKLYADNTKEGSETILIQFKKDKKMSSLLLESYLASHQIDDKKILSLLTNEFIELIKLKIINICKEVPQGHNKRHQLVELIGKNKNFTGYKNSQMLKEYLKKQSFDGFISEQLQKLGY